MRPEQLQKARAASELWKAKTPVAESNSVEIPDAWNSDASETASTPPAGADMVKAIRNIQIILNQNGYDAGSPDGKLGAKTKTAIAAYQKANGMASTGEVDEALVKSLLKKVKS
jgi:localization factor PodJL